MECPRCGAKTYVTKSIAKRHFVKRYRVCSKKRCKWRFTTTELISSDWDYERILKKVYELVKDVKFRKDAEYRN